MTPEQHRMKASRLERSMGKCAPEDYEALIEGALLAAGHWFNVALHDMGFYPVQKDVMHLTKMPVEDLMRVHAVAPALVQAYEEMEELRSPFVRGNEPGGPEAARRCLVLLGEIKELAQGIGPHGLALPASWNGEGK